MVGAIASSGETQKALAKKLGITERTMTYKMTGRRDFTISEVETICEHFKKDYYELFK